ncbi:WD40 repeat-like protein [Conidiobolus coronatus NRRL 28638]|uniref:WD40 repeat-like protein n=1 Tax=Conidiobolus coronatus (strain ATCC 28846 / CBS 209.66 / NRRL 28638) TaxID=796925 RepID=A0A137PAX1_CONC2|nr:WD40 repeat-like protein [Conidiobolus coronatus NRRL 28638]|eukprot:KXN72149.1 WD40 repeat-like protein [Conidiobolus coronatus NRRL 28638]
MTSTNMNCPVSLSCIISSYPHASIKTPELASRISQEYHTLPSAQHNLFQQTLNLFNQFDPTLRSFFIVQLLSQFNNKELSFVSECIKPLLKFDIIGQLPLHITKTIFTYLDHKSLCQTSVVCKLWKRISEQNCLWKTLCEQHINKKCTKCGWGLPVLLDVYLKRKRSEWLHQQQVAQHQQGRNTNQLTQTPLTCSSPDTESSSSNWSPRKRIAFQPTSPQPLSPHNRTNSAPLINSTPVTAKEPEGFWKSIFRERMMIELNWRRGHFQQFTLKAHTDSVKHLQACGPRLMTASSDSTVRLWDLNTNKPLHIVQGDGMEQVTNLQFDDCRLVTSVKLWDLVTKTCIQEYSGHVGEVTCFQAVVPPNMLDNLRSNILIRKSQPEKPYNANNPFEMANCTLVTGSSDNTIKVWSLVSGHCIRTIFGHLDGVECLAVDTLRIVSGSRDWTVKVWDFDTGACMHTLVGPQDAINCISLADTRIIAGSEDSQVYLWDCQMPPNSTN